MSSISIERERRWLVKEFPDSLRENSYKYDISQVYLSEKSTLRVRKYSAPGGISEYELTFKEKQPDGDKKEINFEILKYQFMSHYNDSINNNDIGLIEKTRFATCIPLHPLSSVGAANLYYDIFRGNLATLEVFEVEFNSVADKEAFVPPFYFGREITNDSRYSNHNLAFSQKIPE